MGILSEGKRLTWEMRTTGDVSFGAGYVDMGGSDYSQQNVAQLTITDLTCNQGRTKVSSSIGGFTSPMIGNVMKITSGSNFTAGYYLIISVLSTNDAILERTPCPAGNGSGGNAKVGGAAVELSDIDQELGANHRVWMKSGTYTDHPTVLTAAGLSSADGRNVEIIGYHSSRGDNPTGGNRPLLIDHQDVATTWTFGMYNDLKNLRFEKQSIGDRPVRINHSRMENCEINGNYYYFTGGTYFLLGINGGSNIVRHCKFLRTGYNNVRGVNIANCNGGIFQHSYFLGLYNSIWGVPLRAPTVESCLFNGASGYAINGNADVFQCVFYGAGLINNEAAIHSSTVCLSIVNNIFHTCYRPIDALAVGWHAAVLSKGNHYFNNSFPNRGRVFEYSSTAGDPLFVNPGAEDFSLQVGSPCLGAGFGLRVGVA